MIDAKAKVLNTGSVGRNTILQLLFCHGMIFTVAVISRLNALPILCACILSLLLMLNIPYNLHLLEAALDRLARGLPVEPIAARPRWPLTGLFVLVNALSQEAGQQVQIERRTVVYHDQLLQQVRKAAAQEELNRLARDLHDSIKQQIFSIVVSVAAIKARWEHNPTGARAIVDDIERTAKEAQVEMQALLQQLRPVALENVGLIESLRVQCQALGYRTDAEITVEAGQLPPVELLPLGAQESIFRIVQEGFANIARYARPSHVWLSLRQQGEVLLVEIGDDGQGFDVAQVDQRSGAYGGMGLSNVRERVSALGGTVTIWSLPGQGTTLHLSIPLVKPQTQEQEKQEVASISGKAQRTLRAGLWAVDLAVALMLLYTPPAIILWPVGVCLVAALVAWFWAQQYRVQFALDFGRTHARHFALLAASYGLLSGILLVGTLYAIYCSFPIVLFPNTWIATGFFSVCVGAILVTYVLSSRNIKLCCTHLSRGQLQEQIRQQVQQVMLDWLVWGSMIAVSVFWLGFPAGGLASNIRAFVLVAWFIVILLKSIRITRWQRMLHTLPERPGQEQKEGYV